MSLLNQLFNRGVFGAKCKTSLNLAISRIKLLQNKRDIQLRLMRKEIAQFLQTGQEAIARIRVEHIIREQNIWAAYEILALFCEFVLARVPIIESQRDCPSELREAIASIIFAAPRCSDLPDLLQIKNLFTTKYGKEFVSAVAELCPDSSVNRAIIEKLSVSAPSGEVKLTTLKAIALEFNVEWDSSSTEAEFSKKYEDLLGGSKQICSEITPPQAPSREAPYNKLSNSNGTHPRAINSGQGIEQLHVRSYTESISSPGSSEIEEAPIKTYNAAAAPVKTYNAAAAPAIDAMRETQQPRPSDVLEKARAAIATAERASAAARAAAELANLKFDSFKLQGK